MPILSLRDTLAVEGAERQRLVEADDAIRDVLTSLDLCASEERLDADLMKRGSVVVLLAAAARQGAVAYSDHAEETLAQGLRALLAEAIVHERELARRARAKKN